MIYANNDILKENMMEAKMKLAKQIFLVLFEVFTCTYILTNLTLQIAPATSLWDLVERYVFCYGIYQFFTYLILSNKNDSEKDMLLALTLNYRRAEFYLSNQNELVLLDINNHVKYQLEETTFNNKDVLNEYHGLEKLLINKDIQMIQYKIIKFEHLVETTSLLWKYNFLLRWMKE